MTATPRRRASESTTGASGYSPTTTSTSSTRGPIGGWPPNSAPTPSARTGQPSRCGLRAPGRQRHRGLQRLGPRRPPPRPPGLLGDLGRRRPRSGSRPHLQIRHHYRPRRGAREGRPLRLRLRVPPPDRLDGLGPQLRLGRRGLDGHPGRAQRPRRPHLHLRGPPRLLEALPGRPREGPQLRQLAPVLVRHALETGFTHVELLPDHGAPLLRLLGVPVDRLLRADGPLRHPRA